MENWPKKGGDRADRGSISPASKRMVLQNGKAQNSCSMMYRKEARKFIGRYRKFGGRFGTLQMLVSVVPRN